jgi:hypothetical protein
MAHHTLMMFSCCSCPSMHQQDVTHVSNTKDSPRTHFHVSVQVISPTRKKLCHEAERHRMQAWAVLHLSSRWEASTSRVCRRLRECLHPACIRECSRRVWVSRACRRSTRTSLHLPRNNSSSTPTSRPPSNRLHSSSQSTARLPHPTSPRHHLLLPTAPDGL